MRRLLCLFTVLVATTSTQLAAQAPDSAMRAYYASLEGRTVDDLETLANSAATPVQKGFAALELHRRSGDMSRANLAARLFSTAVMSNRNDAWAHFGLGATLFRERKTMAVVRTMGAADGQASAVAQRELEKALDLAPNFTEAADVLGTLAQRLKDPKAMERARTVLTKGANGGESIARLDLALNDTAAVLKPDAVSALDFLRRAMVLFGKRDAKAGGEAYLAGIDKWDEGAANTYIADALIIASPEESAKLTGGTLQQRADALRLFWQKRSVRDGVSVAERLMEHYRRLAIARKAYSRSDRRGAPGAGALLTTKPGGVAKEIDDRGVILARYGEPFDKIIVHNGMTQPNESWVYVQPDGTYQTFRFVDMNSSGGYELIADPVLMLLDNSAYLKFKMGGYAAWLQLASDENIGNAEQLFNELGRYDPAMKLMAMRLSTLNSESKSLRSGAWTNTAQDIHTDNIVLTAQLGAKEMNAVRLDAAPPQFDRPMIVYHDFATFRGRGCTDVVFSLATRAESYHVRVEVADTLNWQSEVVDSLVSKPVPSGGYLRSTGVLCTTPNAGKYMRFTVSSDAQTGATAGGSFNIPDYSGKNLMISDLLFATPEDGSFVRGNAHLALVPPRQFKQNEPFRVFYELYNVPRGRRYKTEITFTTTESNPLAKLFKGKKKTTVSFESEAATDDVVQELRTLVPEIEPGKVEVAVKVTDTTTGQSATRSENIWILPAPNQ